MGDQVSFLSSWAPGCRAGIEKVPFLHTCKMLHKILGRKRSLKTQTHPRELPPLLLSLRSMRR